MGAFYVNYTFKGADREAVMLALAGRKAFVSAKQNQYVFAFDKESDHQDQAQIAKLAARASSITRSTVFVVLNHDSDILWYQLYEVGQLTDQYNSTPDYWSPKSEASHPKGGNAIRLCAAFGSKEIAEAERILRAPRESYPDATRRHSDLLRLLRLPELAVGYGFSAIERGYIPQGMSTEDLIAVS
jgi:hypothetical protein